VRVLVTRPQPAAAALAARLAALGHQAVVEPLLTIVPEVDAGERLALALVGAQAVLFTSGNGVEAFAAASARRDLRVFAVGDATAKAARAAGFTEVECAGGDVASLVALVRSRASPGAGALVHARGSDVAGDLAGDLATAGFTLRRIALYRAIAAETLGSSAIAAFQHGLIDAALFFSPRTAAAFVRLARAAGIEDDCAAVVAVALSPAVAAELGALAWQSKLTAAEPTETAILDRLARLAAAPARADQDR
jgi:uroporphyrinogen-III synthase